MYHFLVSALAGGGRMAMVGIFDGQPAVGAGVLFERELEVRGCSVFCRERQWVLAYLELLAEQLQRRIRADVGLDDLPGEFARLLAGQSPELKTVVLS